MTESINLIVDTWTLVWTALVVLGQVSQLTPWPRLSALRSASFTTSLLFSSGLLVLVVTLAGETRTAAIVTAWAIVMSSVKLLADALERQ